MAAPFKYGVLAADDGLGNWRLVHSNGDRAEMEARGQAYLRNNPNKQVLLIKTEAVAVSRVEHDWVAA